MKCDFFNNMFNKNASKKENNIFTGNFTPYCLKFFKRDFAKNLKKKIYTILRKDPNNTDKYHI
jgi:hypothetical protein